MSAEEIQKIVDAIELKIVNREEKEIPSSLIGEIVMEGLKELDPVAYVRFASVYREFKDVNTFMDELKNFMKWIFWIEKEWMRIWLAEIRYRRVLTAIGGCRQDFGFFKFVMEMITGRPKAELLQRFVTVQLV